LPYASEIITQQYCVNNKKQKLFDIIFAGVYGWRVNKIQRSPDQTGISISMSKQELAKIDERAAELGLPRSKYLVLLARRDIATGGGLTLEASSISKIADSIVSDAMPATGLAVPASYKSKPKAVSQTKALRGKGLGKKAS
jgi:predicted DNA binding CopG/RHH family protein